MVLEGHAVFIIQEVHIELSYGDQLDGHWTYKERN